jgi:AcrR family transcriptional regulator
MAAERSGGRSSNYHSPLRARQAAQTRRSIIEAAGALFAERGWSTATLPVIAERAGVSVDTIYATFGTKVALLMAVVDVAIMGDDDEAAMVDRPDFAELGRGRRAERLRTAVRYTMAVYHRSVPVLGTLREAAASDDVAHDRFLRYDEDRRRVMAAGLQLILGREPSGPLVDAVAALVSPEVYTYLTHSRGWSTQEVEDWFVDMAKAAIDRS